MHGHIFCGLRCRLDDLVRNGKSRLLAILTSPIPTMWIVLVLSVVVLALGSWIGSLVVRLAAVTGETDDHFGSLPYAVAEIVRDGGDLRIEIQGSPGATVVLIANGSPVRMVVLDDDGSASIGDMEIADSTALEIATLAEPPEAVLPPPTSTSTTTKTSSPVSVAPLPGRATPPMTSSPTATQTFTSAATAIATAAAPPALSPTRTPRPADAQPTEKPTRTRPPRRTTDSKPSVSPPVLHLVTDSGNRIAVTFDGNASSNGTADLLDTLKDLDLEITLFVTGGFIDRYPTLVRRAVLAGHEVGNHTFSHPHLTTYAQNQRHRLLPNVTKKWFLDQLERTEVAFQKATGRPMAPLWRAPYGEENSTLRGWALELGYLHVRWSSLQGASLDARDWVADEHSKLYQDSRRMMDRLLGFPRLEGGIVLMHLATERSEPPWTELPRFVRELKRREVQTVKISQLLEGSKTWRKWLERARENHQKNFPE